jgi:hypothetical protein
MKRSVCLFTAVLFVAALTSPNGSAQSTSGQGYFFGPGVPSLLGLNLGDVPIDSANTVYVWQFTLTACWTIRTATYITGNSLSYPTYPLGFGIYSCSGSKLLDVYFDTTATYETPVTLTFSAVTLSPGVYYFAQAQPASGISAHTIEIDSAGGSISLTQLLSTINNPAYTLYTSPIAGTAGNAMSSGVLPSTLGTISPLTDTYISPAAVLWTP